MSLKKHENQKAIDKAVDLCDSAYESKGLHYQQDCIQGVNIMRRIVRRGISVQSAERAAQQVCLINEKYPGPRLRCQGGVRKLARELKRR